MYLIFQKPQKTNSYELYQAMSSEYDSFLTYANQVGIVEKTIQKCNNITNDEMKNQLIQFQNDLISSDIKHSIYIDKYRFLALALLNIAINGYGTNTFNEVEILELFSDQLF